MKYTFLLILTLVVINIQAAPVYTLTTSTNGSHRAGFSSRNGDIVDTVTSSLSGYNLDSYDVIYVNEHKSSSIFNGYESTIRSKLSSGALAVVYEYCNVALISQILGGNIAGVSINGSLSNTSAGSNHATITGSGLQNGAALSTNVNSALNNQSRRSFTQASVDALDAMSNITATTLIKDSGGNAFAVEGTYGSGRFFFVGGETLESSGGSADEKLYAHNYIQYAATDTASPALGVNTSSVNFGNVRVGTSKTANVTVTNDGDAGTNLTGNIGSASGSEFSPTSGNQNFNLGQNATASRTFTYEPDNQGIDSTNVLVSTNEDGNTNVTLSGTGVSPVFSSSVAPDSTIDFGMIHLNTSVAEHPDIPPTKYETIRISNITADADLGNLTDLSILDASISGDGTFDLINFTPTVIAKGGYLDITIRYSTIMAHNGGVSPSQGIKNAVLTLVTDQNAAFGETGDTFTFNLTGEVVPEPGSFILLGFALICIFPFMRKNR